jgi:inner membrane protein
MDTITHIALGGVTGYAMLGREIGKKAIYTGAALQCLPDVDFAAALWTDVAENLLAHRGFTHSFLFVALAVPGISWLLYQKSNPIVSFKQWVLFTLVQLITHLLIDACNAYGVGWFEPFSHERISFNLIFVADPFFSASLGIAFIILFFTNKSYALKTKWTVAALIISSGYLVYTMINKRNINNQVRQTLTEKKIGHSRFITTPTPFNNWLWYVVAESDSGYHIGYRSVVDKKPMTFHYFKRNEHLLNEVADHESLQHLIRFSEGYYTVSSTGDTLLFNDLRFGQIMGWQNPSADFVFHYYLEHPENNTLVLQRGRFVGWNRATIVSLINRIRGIDTSSRVSL